MLNLFFLYILNCQFEFHAFLILFLDLFKTIGVLGHCYRPIYPLEIILVQKVPYIQWTNANTLIKIQMV